MAPPGERSPALESDIHLMLQTPGGDQGGMSRHYDVHNLLQTYLQSPDLDANFNLFIFLAHPVITVMLS